MDLQQQGVATLLNVSCDSNRSRRRHLHVQTHLGAPQATYSADSLYVAANSGVSFSLV